MRAFGSTVSIGVISRYDALRPQARPIIQLPEKNMHLRLVTLAAVMARSRVAAIVVLGVVGFTMTVWFYSLGAADVALTQLLVEVLTVVVISAARTLGVNMSRRLVSIGTALGRSLLGMRSDHPLRRRRPTKVTTRIAITPASA